jgi:hypothetical protein
MALDFAILGEDGKPYKQVALGVNEHHKLIADAKESKAAPIFNRFVDYYADGEVKTEELDAFLGELSYLESINQGSPFLKGLMDLVYEAQEKKVSIHVIAD